MYVGVKLHCTMCSSLYIVHCIMNYTLQHIRTFIISTLGKGSEEKNVTSLVFCQTPIGRITNNQHSHANMMTRYYKQQTHQLNHQISNLLTFLGGGCVGWPVTLSKHLRVCSSKDRPTVLAHFQLHRILQIVLHLPTFNLGLCAHR